MTPKLIAQLYASYEENTGFREILWALGTLFVAEYFVQVIYQVSLSKYIQHLLATIRNRSFSNWVRSYESVGSGVHGDSKYPMGEVLARVLSDTEAVIEMVSSGSFKIFIDMAYIISCLVSFIALNSTSGVVLIFVEVMACVVLIVGSKKMGQVYASVRKSMGRVSRVIANLAGGFRYSYYTVHNNYASKKSYGYFEDFLKKQLQANIWDAGYFSIAESLFPILLAILVLVFPYSNITEMAVLAAIVDLIQRSIQPIKEVASKISAIQRTKASLNRIIEFNKDIQQLPMTSFEEQEHERFIFDSLEVDVKRFSYPKNNDAGFALSSIQFSANSGELVGLVGLSGSGKSTLLKILSTDIVAKDAVIKLNSKDDNSIIFSKDNLQQIESYKKHISIVSQDSHVFTESLLFNITLQTESSERFEAFWLQVQEEVPYLKRWGVTPSTTIYPKELSLGQKQLLSALRSCYLTKPVVLFDEISSGLDSELELALRKLVLLIQSRSLTIIVAHRIETIVNADQIIVLDQGKVERIGCHEVLIKSSTTYQEFISLLQSTL